MKRIYISIVVAVIFSFFFVSCYYDNEEALYPTLSNTCDTTNVTYSGKIAPILNNSCTGCHSGSIPSGSILLTNFASVQTIASSGLLMNALNGNGVNVMPPSGSLPACNKTQFQIWVTAGIPNN
jgi:cytochrome c5